MVKPFPSLLILFQQGLNRLLLILLFFKALMQFILFYFLIRSVHSKYFCYGSLACSLLLLFSLYPGRWTGCVCSQSRSHCRPVHQEDRIIRTSFRPEALLFLHHTQHPIVWIYLGPKSILNWFHSWQICVFHLVLGPGFHMNISNHFIFFQVEVLLHADNLYMTSENEKIKGWLKTRQIPVFARVQQNWFLLWKEQWQNLSL